MRRLFSDYLSLGTKRVCKLPITMTNESLESNVGGEMASAEDNANANFGAQQNHSVNSVDQINFTPLSINNARQNDNFSTIARISTRNSEAVTSNKSFSDPLPSLSKSRKYHHDTPYTYSITLKTTSTPSRTPNLSNSWEFAGWGSTYYIELPTNKSPGNEIGTLLGQWRATSIAGNDLVASVLYTIGICTVVAGKYAPISLFIVTLILYPFQGIMSEVGSALPLNGGSYNCLLNTSSKWFATVAAALELLDYVTTAVVSAATATSYLSGQFNLSSFVVFWMTVGLLIVTAGVVILGIKDSSNLAFTIFLFHCFTLTLLMVASVVRWIIQGNSVLAENWKDPGSGNPMLDIFYGTCIGLLGITGFETSVNYIEEQKPGVYQKTVRNMWALSSFFNAPISLLALAIMPISTFKVHQNDIISTMGGHAAGSWLQTLVTIDAIIVLGAGVLTGFVGATGLIHRMASDRILPQYLLYRNKFAGTYHWIIVSFLIFCVTLYAIVGGDLTSLSGVFAVSFLSVLCMFAIGNILLKYKRGRLYRTVRVSTGVAMFGVASILTGLIGNIIYNPSIFRYFVIYFGILFSIMLMMLNYVWILKTLFFYLDKIVILHKYKVADVIVRLIRRRKNQPVVFFTNTDEIHILNKGKPISNLRASCIELNLFDALTSWNIAVLYVKSSESSGHLKFIHLYERIEDIPPRLEANHRVLDELYPKIQIDLMFIQGKFDPETVGAISAHLKIPKSLMFISCPGEKFPYKIGEFGGSCNSKRFRQNFERWTSGNVHVDNLIKRMQEEATSSKEILEWIPWIKLKNFRQVGRGGFGAVHVANWVDGYIAYWQEKDHDWGRYEGGSEVAVKVFENSSNITEHFLEEIFAAHRSNVPGLIRCFGLTQQPRTKNYALITEYASVSLRQVIHSPAKSSLNAQDYSKEKLKILMDIASTLDKLHSLGIVHKNLHSGNILKKSNSTFMISDLGLCFQANKHAHDKEFYGVDAYTAPEVKRGKPHTKESDIYSFGVLILEVFTKSIIFPNVQSETRVEVRPEIPDKLPSPISHLITRCWEEVPENRMHLDEVHRVLSGWWANLWDQADHDLMKQFEACDLQYITSSRKFTISKCLNKIAKEVSFDNETDSEDEFNPHKPLSEDSNIDFSGLGI
ncbi:2329_t:CDS:10 [Acaulospora morrowiae]|uniref:2329_t:CDS:1 n=1 Tax=Acaulospora morrowiae TaxID=94023 RepID=A0A9N8VZH5_9GLOM|nr:2329_t:CDS:10 [Acaulospora morrowiae]